MTRTIQRLVKQGYVLQVPGKDKREKLIQLTDVALKMFPEWEKTVIETNHLLMKHFPETSQEELFHLQKSWLQQLL